MATATHAVQLDDKVTSFVGKKQKMLINGKWVDSASGKTFPTYNPATGEVLCASRRRRPRRHRPRRESRPRRIRNRPVVED